MSLENNLDANYWNERWENEKTPWDMGSASPALMSYMSKVSDKDLSILIAGCGNAHEAEALLDMGFTNITLVDIASKLVEKLQVQFQNKIGIKVILADFFELENSYDIILEQTFFCALNPEMRLKYAETAHKLLKDDGRLVGVLFNKNFETAGPPFGGSAEEYKTYFEPNFQIEKMENCYNSIPPRQGSELFINFKKIQ